MSTTTHDTEHTRDGRTVRVRCPDPDHGRAGIDLVARCEWCGEWITDAGGTILATLADPDAVALMEDGVRWRNLKDKYTHAEAREMFGLTPRDGRDG